MKVKFQQKSSILKYIKISNKWVSPCHCLANGRKPFQVHAYCLTAWIIIDQSIACDTCQFQYNLYIREEAICSGKLFTIIIQYIIVLLVILIFGILFLTADTIMKIEHAQTEPKELEQTMFYSPADIVVTPNSMEKSHNYSDFSFLKSIHWNDVLHFSGVLLLVATWGFYSQFNKALQ